MTPGLSLRDRRLLALLAHLVPGSERADWLRSWTAELWHARKGDRTAALSMGLMRDALWLRAESCRRRLRGTAVLCLLTLAGFCLFSAAAGLLLERGMAGFLQRIADESGRTLLAAPLVLLVAFALAANRTADRTPDRPGRGLARRRLRRQIFLHTKSALLLLLAFLVSGDLCEPVHCVMPLTADCLQILFFVVIGLVGLRWAWSDQALRCKHCLALLGEPARVGRPSHNLLEWNGLQLACHRGHGLLRIPELETSWRQSSEWSPGRP